MDLPNPSDYFIANSRPIAEDPPTTPSFLTNLHLYDLLVNQPPPSILPSEASSVLTSDSDFPSSILPSEVSSAVASDSDLPPPSTKATKQTNLHGFFSSVPSEEPHARWRKRKRDNKEKDREEYAERKKEDEAERLRKLTNKRIKNQISQKKRRDRMKEEEAALSETGQDSPVSSFDDTMMQVHTYNPLGGTHT